MVVDNLGAECSDGSGHALLVADVEAKQFRLAMDVALRSSAEIVEDGDLMPSRDVRVDDVRADEPGPTCDENLHVR